MFSWLNLWKSGNSGAGGSQPPSTQLPPPARNLPRTGFAFMRQRQTTLGNNNANARLVEPDSSSAPASPPPPSVLQEPVAAALRTPPNWTHSLARASTQIHSPFLRIPVLEDMAEYKEIAKLFGPKLQMTQLDRVVNPELWKRFVRARADLLASKSTDLNLLAELGLNDAEIALKTHVLLNFDNPHLNGSPFCDNVVLLFHGVKGGLDALENIFSQGLDDRLANGGIFGCGIYFADRPSKAMQYDKSGSGVLVLCAVMLGDCVFVQPQDKKTTATTTATGQGHQGVLRVDYSTVREPEKEDTQKRNPQDLFFDSIVGRRQAAAKGANEYVIFNRAHCCPIYAVSYTKSEATSWALWRWERAQTSDEGVIRAQSQIPSFAWTSKDADVNSSSAQPQPQLSSSHSSCRGSVNFGFDGFDDAQEQHCPEKSPLYAARIFEAMASDEDSQNNDNGDYVSENRKVALMTLLKDFGFMDTTENERVLRLFRYNIDRTIDHLMKAAEAESHALEIAFEDPKPGTSTSADTDTEKNRNPPPPTPSESVKTPEEEECLICTVKYPVTAEVKVKVPMPAALPETATQRRWWRKRSSAGAGDLPTRAGAGRTETRTGAWETLPCSHKLCITCADRIGATGTTMSGQTHMFIKCPFCQSATGIQIGDCANGTMTETKIRARTPAGYEGELECNGSISIQYIVQTDGQSLNRIAYLPNNPEGRAVLELLRIAWDRRLIFTVGTSLTTGRSNVLVWNIHHKTALDGGVSRHGYPDPTYLQRVRDELAQYGIQ